MFNTDIDSILREISPSSSQKTECGDFFFTSFVCTSCWCKSQPFSPGWIYQFLKIISRLREVSWGWYLWICYKSYKWFCNSDVALRVWHPSPQWAKPWTGFLQEEPHPYNACPYIKMQKSLLRNWDAASGVRLYTPFPPQVKDTVF